MCANYGCDEVPFEAFVELKIDPHLEFYPQYPVPALRETEPPESK
jgi:hypothetical protein